MSRHTTPTQREQSHPDQVENNAGGFVWEITPMQRLQRFLVLGAEGGTYYQGERDFVRENIACIDECLAADADGTLALTHAISRDGRAYKNDAAIYVLAKALAYPDVNTRRRAVDYVPEICRTGTHLFMLEHFVLGLRGHGRTFRRGLASWYETKTPDNLAYQMVKYRERKFDSSRKTGRRHADVIKTARPKKADDQAWNNVIRWAIGKDAENLPDVITGFELAQKAESPAELVNTVNQYSLPWEALPRDMMTAEVWQAVLPHMPMMAMTRNLATLTRTEAVKPMSDEASWIVNQLKNVDAIRKSKMHPLHFLAAHITYTSGHSFRGSSTWTPISSIVDATDAAFYLAFGNVAPTGKRMCLALDVSGSMRGNPVSGIPGLDAAQAAAAMALVTARVEPYYQVVAFSGNGPNAWKSTNGGRFGGYRSDLDGISELAITPRQRLDDVTQAMGAMTFGSTDCALPMLWATEKNRNFDMFVIYTDNETWEGNVHVDEALRRYRNKVNPQAKVAVVAMTATNFSIADPNDAGMLDVVGFDTSTPNVIAEFANM